MERLMTAVGRAVLGWLFVHAGWRVLRVPGPATAQSAQTLAALRTRLPGLPISDQAIVQGNAALHVAAGTLVVAGRACRPAALALAASMVPTTAAGHPFWTLDDPAARRAQRAHFDKNVAIVGGLLAVAGAASPRPRG